MVDSGKQAQATFLKLNNSMLFLYIQLYGGFLLFFPYSSWYGACGIAFMSGTTFNLFHFKSKTAPQSLFTAVAAVFEIVNTVIGIC